jgi:hypothetical protein
VGASPPSRSCATRGRDLERGGKVSKKMTSSGKISKVLEERALFAVEAVACDEILINTFGKKIILATNSISSSIFISTQIFISSMMTCSNISSTSSRSCCCFSLAKVGTAELRSAQNCSY